MNIDKLIQILRFYTWTVCSCALTSSTLTVQSHRAQVRNLQLALPKTERRSLAYSAEARTIPRFVHGYDLKLVAPIDRQRLSFLNNKPPILGMITVTSLSHTQTHVACLFSMEGIPYIWVLPGRDRLSLPPIETFRLLEAPSKLPGVLCARSACPIQFRPICHMQSTFIIYIIHIIHPGMLRCASVSLPCAFWHWQVSWLSGKSSLTRFLALGHVWCTLNDRFLMFLAGLFKSCTLWRTMKKQTKGYHVTLSRYTVSLFTI